jgi:flagellar motor switch protein FliM
MPQTANQKSIHPSNLKSFQRISAQDMRYLKELGDAAARQREMSDPTKISLGQKLRRAVDFHVQTVRRLVDRLLYENVPAENTLISDQADD